MNKFFILLLILSSRIGFGQGASALDGQPQTPRSAASYELESRLREVAQKGIKSIKEKLEKLKIKQQELKAAETKQEDSTSSQTSTSPIEEKKWEKWNAEEYQEFLREQDKKCPQEEGTIQRAVRHMADAAAYKIFQDNSHQYQTGPGLDPAVCEKAKSEFEKFKRKSDPKINKNDYISIVDFSKDNQTERYFLVEPQTCKVIFRSKVAHGAGSADPNNPRMVGKNMCGNAHKSHKSSNGSMVVGAYHAYKGMYSGIRVHGQEARNRNVNDRDVIFHEEVKGYDGITHGCFGFPQGKDSQNLFKVIRGGSFMYVHAPQCENGQEAGKLASK